LEKVGQQKKDQLNFVLLSNDSHGLAKSKARNS
jgi:hypothetical protein